MSLDRNEIRAVVERVMAKAREESGEPPLTEAEIAAKWAEDTAKEIRSRGY